jgi:hypothetical protein
VEYISVMNLFRDTNVDIIFINLVKFENVSLIKNKIYILCFLDGSRIKCDIHAFGTSSS